MGAPDALGESYHGSFASLALATEDPNKPNGLKEQVLGRFPYKRTDPLLSDWVAGVE